jgi:hypothetical protein
MDDDGFGVVIFWLRPAPRGCVADFEKPRWSPPQGFLFFVLYARHGTFA